MDRREGRRSYRRITIKECWIEYFRPLSVEKDDKKNKTPVSNSELEPHYSSGLDSSELDHRTPGHIPNDLACGESGAINAYQWQGTLGASESARRYWLFLREHGWTD